MSAVARACQRGLRHDGAVTKWLVLALLTACSSAPDEEEPDELVDLGKGDGAWACIGKGVAYQRVNAGDAVLIAYGGYTARIVDSAVWASELVDARLGGEGVGHIYAVKGPADAAYAAREIGNSKLRASLPAGTSRIYIVAHSSGAFVAHELLGQLRGDADTLARIVYANLDGGGSGLTTQIVEALGGIAFVYARDPAVGLSRNASSMKSNAAAYDMPAFEVVVPQTGCISSWCLHDVVITHRPHNPHSFDLARDYASMSITTEYFDAFH
jgi:hypothetical protein